MGMLECKQSSATMANNTDSKEELNVFLYYFDSLSER